jgi:hypothetical protein
MTSTARRTAEPDGGGSPGGTAGASPALPMGDGAVRRAWSRTAWRALAAPVLVLLPLLTVAPGSDNRFNVHRYGAEYAIRPWQLVTDQLASVPRYLTNHGNFRPFGRMLERSFDVLTFSLSSALGLPANIAMRLVHLAAAAVLGLVLLLTVEAMTSRRPLAAQPPSAAAQLLPLTFAALLVAAGGTSTIVVFTDLYFASMALVLGVALAAARHRWLTTDGLTPGSAAAALVVGAALAAFNEITALALPLTVVAVLARGHLTMELPWRTLVRRRAVLATGVGSIGFAAVFVPVRMMIASSCADGECYEASDVSIDPAFFPALGHRALTWVPPLAWRAATAETEGHWYLTRNPVLMLLLAVLAVLGWRTAVALRRSRLPRRRELLALALLGACALGLGATLAALSSFVQGLVDTWPIGTGWRDVQILVAGAAALLVAAVLAPLRASRETVPLRAAVGASVLVTVLAGGSMLSNHTFAELDARSPASALHNEIALALISPADRAGGEERRCDLLREFEELYPDDESWHDRLREAVDTSMQVRYGLPFCGEAPDDT